MLHLNSRLPSREAASPRRSIAVMGTDRAASASASCPSYQLASGDPASDQGGERGRSVACTAGIFSVRPLPSSALGRDQLKGAASPTVGMKGLASSAMRQKRGNREARSAQGPAPHSSSGGGLGIHQPGSNTRGTRAKVQTPSGRAAEAAMCPAVARSFQGRAA